ncbi:MAG: PIG-L deacetylase family protein [Thermomicrobiales bacterium]
MMQSRPTILFVFAHPDDETFLAAGTMAVLRDQGWRVVVVSATRGEEGEIAEGVPATRESLGDFREAELRAAMHVVGVEDVRFLGYRDSGMDGTPENDAPGAFMRVDTDEVGRRVLAIIDEIQPDITIGFGPEGIYLHPDHIAAHRGLKRAIELSAEESGHHQVKGLLFASVPREWFTELWNIEGNPFAEMPFDVVQQMGVPASEITHSVNVLHHRDLIYQALMCHASQFGTGDPFDWLPSHLEEQFVGFDYFTVVPLPWNENPELPEVFESLP